MSARERIHAEIDTMVSKFLYYDRKEDDELPRGAIEAEIDKGEITEAEIVNGFDARLMAGLTGLRKAKR